jgi:magnesium chelatase family protein
MRRATMMDIASAPVLSATLRGVDAIPIHIEIDIAPGLPAFTMVGLAEAAVRESRVRVQAACANSRLLFPIARIAVNLAPAHLKKDGTGFDLPIALGILAAQGTIPKTALANVLAFGELSMSGDVRPVRGALAAAEAALAAGRAIVLVARENGPEAALVHGVAVRTVATLADAVAFLAHGDQTRAPIAQEQHSSDVNAPLRADLADVKGQATARLALEVAAAGGHNLLYLGGPGAGKTMLARRLPSILPPLTRDEALEVTRVHSVAGLNIGGGLVAERPFRAPHHSTTPAGLVGGGAALPRPGEVTLAHRGVLFLDELPEFARHTLEALREPLEAGEVVLCRASGTVRYPARTLVVASMNPCPCGYHGSARCRCGPLDVDRYQGRISGPLLDRIDISVRVEPLPLAILEDDAPAESSALVAARVVAARARQSARFADGRTNATALPVEIAACARPDLEGKRALAAAVMRFGLSARAYDRILRVARTFADLRASDAVEGRDIMQTLSLRIASLRSAAPAGLTASPW